MLTHYLFNTPAMPLQAIVLTQSKRSNPLKINNKKPAEAG